MAKSSPHSNTNPIIAAALHTHQIPNTSSSQASWRLLEGWRPHAHKHTTTVRPRRRGHRLASLGRHGVDAPAPRATRQCPHEGTSCFAGVADGFNPLMFAALFGKVECVAAVLRHCRRHKKIINETNPEGDTALSLAALHGQRKVVQLLLRDGADVDAANRKGETALHAAAKNGHAQVVCALLTGGADVDKVDQLGYTALHHCCITNGGEDVADALLEVRATVDVKAKDDNTALHFACSAGNHMMVEALLRRKVNLTVRNNINQVAFDVAVKAGHDNVQQKLQPVRFHLQTQLQEINLAEQYTEARKFVKDCTPGPRQTHTKFKDQHAARPSRLWAPCRDRRRPAAQARNGCATPASMAHPHRHSTRTRRR